MSCRLLENHYTHQRPQRRRTAKTCNGDATGQRDSWSARRGILHTGKWTRIPQQLLMTIIKTLTPWQHVSASDDSGTSMAALFTCLFAWQSQRAQDGCSIHTHAGWFGIKSFNYLLERDPVSPFKILHQTHTHTHSSDITMVTIFSFFNCLPLSL